MVQAVHTAIKGRARFKINELYRSQELKMYLERSLATRSEIISISANILTSNILVIFDRTINVDNLKALIEEFVTNYNRQKRDFQTTTLSENLKRSPELVIKAEKQTTEDWHFMAVDSVLETLQTSQIAGLSDDSVVEKLQKYGLNALPESATRSDLKILLDQFKSLPVGLLGVAAGISCFTEGLVDALVILGVIGLNAAIGYATESQSEKIIHSLKSREPALTWSIRNGTQTEIPTENVVLGDILVLKPGSYIVADARLLEADRLSIDESALTGESLPVTKTTASLTGVDIPLGDRLNMVYKGTVVTGGRGLAAVVATGGLTQVGKIQQQVDAATATETPLARQLDEVGTQLVLLSMGICGLVFGIGVLRGYGLLQMLKSSISLAVAAVPEGLPTIATTTLALGIQDMRQHNVLIRSLSAVEALGSVQTICLDKTGTITENRMSVVEIHTDSRQIQVNDCQFLAGAENINPYACDELLKLIHVTVLCNESQVSQAGDEFTVTGSATENALIYLAIAAGVDANALKQKYPLLQTQARSENRNYMSTIHATDEAYQLVAVKGSPTEVVQICQWWQKNGQLVPLTPEARLAIEIENDRMAGKALRVLGVAYARSVEDNDRQELIWLGLVGMADPVRVGAKELMRDFHHAGIDTVMITGDQSPTAYAIAKELQLSQDEQLEILDSTHLDRLTPEALTALVDKVDVFARISPSNKLQIVQALQAAGKVVAMTGDGINDAPALKAAEVGVAMGKGGTDVAREVADIILEDDRLETMIVAVSRGRTIYNNIRKSVHFLLSTNLSEILVMTTATTVGLGEPLNAIQLLWLNLVTDIFPGLALALEPPEPNVLSQPPRSPQEPIIKNSDFSRIAFESATISLCTLGAYGYGIFRYGVGQQASTIAFLSLTSAQLLHTISCRSETHSVFSQAKLPQNQYLNMALVGSFTLQVLALSIPPLRSILKITPIDLFDGAAIGASALLPLLANESTKNTQLGESQ